MSEERIILNYPRGYGKTSVLINMVASNPDGVLIVMDARKRDEILYDHPELKHNQVIAFSTISSPRGRNLFGKKLYIDDVDLIVERIIGCNIAGCNIAAMSITDEKSDKVKVKFRKIGHESDSIMPDLEAL